VKDEAGRACVRISPVKTPEELSAVFRKAGAKGGRAGTGKAKTRSRLHYQRAGALGALARWGKKRKKKGERRCS
jgi:hypothetical protein